MEIIVVASLIFLGLILALTEVLLVPGTTIVGLIGLVFWAAGVGFAYTYFGSTIGGFVLGGSLLACVILLPFSIRAGTWKALVLKKTHLNRTNEELDKQKAKVLSIGMQGKTRSALRPIGQVVLGKMTIEARTYGEYVAENVPIKIIGIEHNIIYVKAQPESPPIDKKDVSL